MNKWGSKTPDGRPVRGWVSSDPALRPPQIVEEVDAGPPVSFEKWSKSDTAGAPVRREGSREGLAVPHPWGDELPPEVEAELEERVVRELKNSKDVDEIIFSVCQETGWSWAHAKHFVSQAGSDHGWDISLARTRVLLAIGCFFLAIGMGMILFSILDLVGQDRFQVCLEMTYSTPFQMLFKSEKFVQCLQVSAGMIVNIYNTLYTGVAMSAGAIIGIILEFRKLKQ